MIREFNKDLMLLGIPDKDVHGTTTSHKMKKDIIDFFSDSKFSDATVLEIGTHMGHTTRILSELFKKVITINKNPVDENYICSDIDNIEYIQMNSYQQQGWPVWDNGWIDASVIMIDAAHSYDAVKMDIRNTLRLLYDGEKYVIFDDYGQHKMGGVKQAVDEAVWLGNMEIVKYIGVEPNTTFGNLTFEDYEGVICLIKQS
jgi:hypothetical protein